MAVFASGAKAEEAREAGLHIHSRVLLELYNCSTEIQHCDWLSHCDRPFNWFPRFENSTKSFYRILSNAFVICEQILLNGMHAQAPLLSAERNLWRKYRHVVTYTIPWHHGHNNMQIPKPLTTIVTHGNGPVSSHITKITRASTSWPSSHCQHHCVESHRVTARGIHHI